MTTVPPSKSPPPLPPYPAPPPHPGASWQQCYDRTSGYPYYWNTISNQVRWDCPPEYHQYQQYKARPPPLPSQPPPSKEEPTVTPSITGFVSAYDDSDEEEEVESKKSIVEAPDDESKTLEDLEAQPDFIGPVIPKMTNTSEENCPITDGGQEDQVSEASLLIKLKEKSETLAQMGGDIDSSVKDIIDPVNIAKIEEDMAEDILSQIEAEKPPDYSDASVQSESSKISSETETENQYPKNVQPVTEHTPSETESPIPSVHPLFPITEPPPPETQPPQPESQPPLPPTQSTLPVVHPPLPESQSTPPSAPQPPKRRLHPSSMLQLACNYGHESDSDTETEVTPRVTVTSQLDRQGRMVFRGGNANWQTEEQKEALDSYKQEEVLQNGSNGHLLDSNPLPEPSGGGVGGGGGRKRRLALPGGRFNKADKQQEKVNTVETESSSGVQMMSFVKSAEVLPGTIEEQKEEVDVKEAETENEEVETDVSLVAAELVEKLEYFKVDEEKVSPLKTLAIKLETLYSAWTAGALTLSYLQVVLQGAKKKISEAEASLNVAPWKAVWDRQEKTYTFTNTQSDHEEDKVEPVKKVSPSPPLPPTLQTEEFQPPLPPPVKDQPPLPPGADHQLQDMEIDEEPVNQPTVNITDEISNFYSELEVGPIPSPSSGPQLLEAEVPPLLPAVETQGSGSSGPSSPVPTETKKRKKKVKVSNNISLKKKGVGDMLAKWQKINE